jgi:hypothetical protein
MVLPAFVGPLVGGLGAFLSSRNQPDSVTTTNEPPAFLQPFLEDAAIASRNALFFGGPEQFPGQTVVPFAPQTEQALGLLEQRALGGSPVTQAAQDLTTSTLRGDFLGGNPFLDGQIQRALDLSRGQLLSEFGSSGRDVRGPDLAAFRGEQVNNLVNDFMFRNFDAERGRQQAALSSAIPLAREDFFDIGQLANVGTTVEGQAQNIVDDRRRRFDFEQARPEAALDQFITRLAGNPFSGFAQQSQPVFNNPFLAGLGGAGLGAQLGGLINQFLTPPPAPTSTFSGGGRPTR